MLPICCRPSFCHQTSRRIPLQLVDLLLNTIKTHRKICCVWKKFFEVIRSVHQLHLHLFRRSLWLVDVYFVLHSVLISDQQKSGLQMCEKVWKDFLLCKKHDCASTSNQQPRPVRACIIHKRSSNASELLYHSRLGESRMWYIGRLLIY
jgi:hypothetical protein